MGNSKYQRDDVVAIYAVTPQEENGHVVVPKCIIRDIRFIKKGTISPGPSGKLYTSKFDQYLYLTDNSRLWYSESSLRKIDGDEYQPEEKNEAISIN